MMNPTIFLRSWGGGAHQRREHLGVARLLPEDRVLERPRLPKLRGVHEPTPEVLGDAARKCLPAARSHRESSTA
jgi:hypothetical protein